MHITSLCLLGPGVWPEVLTALRSYAPLVDQMIVAVPTEEPDGSFARWGGGTYRLPDGWQTELRAVSPRVRIVPYDVPVLTVNQSIMEHINAPVLTKLSECCRPGIVLALDADEVVSSWTQLREELEQWSPATHGQVQFEAWNGRHVLKRCGDDAIVAVTAGPDARGYWIGYTTEGGSVAHQCGRWVPGREPFPIHTVIYNLTLCWSPEVTRAKLARSQEYLGGDADALFAWWEGLTVDSARGAIDPWPHGDGRWWHRLEVVPWEKVIAHEP